MITIFSNNNLVSDFLKANPLPVEIKHLICPAFDVLIKVRAKVKSGGVLVSNPMAGIYVQKETLNPMAINPYLSLIVSVTEKTIDFNSMRMLDQAIAVYKKHANLQFISHSDETVDNFKNHDLQDLIAALNTLISPNVRH